MKVPRIWFRPSLRRLMAAVAVIAAGLAAASLWLRHERLRRLAEVYHQRADAEYLATTFIFQRTHFGPSVPEQAEMQAHERLGAHYEALHRKYRHAARRPWLPVHPDPQFHEGTVTGSGRRVRSGRRGRVQVSVPWNRTPADRSHATHCLNRSAGRLTGRPERSRSYESRGCRNPA